MFKLIVLISILGLQFTTSAGANECESWFGRGHSSAPPSAASIRIYPPAHFTEGRRVTLGLAADIFGELHRLHELSPSAFEHARAVLQLAEIEHLQFPTMTTRFEHPRTREAVAEADRADLWFGLSVRGASASDMVLIEASRLIDGDGHATTFAVDVLGAAMAEIKYAGSGDLWSGSGRVFEVIPTDRLNPSLRYAPEVAAAHLYDPLAQNLAIERPRTLDFGPLDYSAQLGLNRRSR